VGSSRLRRLRISITNLSISLPGVRSRLAKYLAAVLPFKTLTNRHIFRMISARVNLLDEMSREDFRSQESRHMTAGRRAYHYKNHLSQGGVVS
jgi:hypothetical protein